MNFRPIAFILSVISICCLLISSPGSAQDSVRLTVSATTGSNVPVLDLTKAEFSLQESAKPAAITTFSGPDTKAVAPPQSQRNEFSNIPDFKESSGAIFVVFDTMTTRYVDERDERAMVLKFLGKATQAKHSVTLAILSDTGLTVYHDYRTGSDVLLAALAKAGLGGMKGVAVPAGLNDAEVSAEAARLTAFSKGAQSNALAENQSPHPSIDVELAMFQEVGFAAAGLTGRKELVWVTNAVPFDIDPKSMQLKSPQVSSHGVAVNGVAVGGTKDQLTQAEIKRLMPLWRQSMRTLFDGGVAVYPVEVRGSTSSATNTLSQIAMKTLAQLTGGKAYFGSNDPFPDLLAVSNGNIGGYVLGFSPPPASNSDLRRLEVTATRAGVEVAHPAGYFPYEGTTKSRAGAEVGLAMSSPLEYTAIRFKVSVASIEDGTGGKKKVNLVISLPGDAGLVNEATGVVDVGLVAAATNAAGQRVGGMNEGAGGKFPPDAVKQIKELGFQLKRSFEVSPGECTVRFLVRDNQSGQMGDIIFPLTAK